MKKLLLNLQTFDDGASAGTSAGEGTTAENTQGVATPTVKGRKGNNLQNVVYGKQDASDDYSAQTKLPGAEKTVTTKETEERSVQFEKMNLIVVYRRLYRDVSEIPRYCRNKMQRCSQSSI